MTNNHAKWVLRFDQCNREDVARVGGKNASLGEMVQSLASEGINVPGGFATTADAYWLFIQTNKLESFIAETLAALDAGTLTLSEAGQSIRTAILKGSWPAELEQAISAEYAELQKASGPNEQSVAVRSSATAEDLPVASFAGQQESYLNIVWVCVGMQGNTAPATTDGIRQCAGYDSFLPYP